MSRLWYNHPAIQKTLSAEKDLTLDKALDIARALEAAEKGTKDLKVEVTPPVSSSYFVPQSHYRRPPLKTLESTQSHKPCYRCGGPHLPSTCKCKDWECFNCKKKGHIASVCKSKKTGEKSSSRRNVSSKSHFVTKKICTHTCNSRSEESDSPYTMFNARNSSVEPIIINVVINGVPISMELDTGASLSVISESTHDQINKVSLTPIVKSTVELKTYLGESIHIIGKISVLVKYKEFHRQSLATPCDKGSWS